MIVGESLSTPRVILKYCRYVVKFSKLYRQTQWLFKFFDDIDATPTEIAKSKQTGILSVAWPMVLVANTSL
jgi:hypothetical protein